MIGIVDYGAGNTRSVVRALAAVGARGRLISGPEGFRGLDRLILPGVGAAGTAMERLRGAGLVESLDGWARSGKPLLGICLGAQLLLEGSDEDEASGLGLIAGRCRRFPRPDEGGPQRVPHVGWNRVQLARGSFDAYFVHGYWLDPADRATARGWTDVDGFRFPSLVREGAIIGTQFHVEKSGATGRRLLEAFATGAFDGDGAAIDRWS